jgi:hypothetical protein
MSSFGFVKDALNTLANNRRLQKSNRERHAMVKSVHYRTSIAHQKEQNPNRERDEKALKAIKKRMRRTRIFENWAYAIFAAVILLLIIWTLFF